MRRNTPGPTHDFPRGKLNYDDEGGLMIAVSQEKDTVRIDFGKKILWLGLPPEVALAFAALIVKHAMAIKGSGQARPAPRTPKPAPRPSSDR